MALDWQRVSVFVRDRRNALGLKQSETPGVSPATWTKIENAQETSYKARTLAAIERALDLPPGTVVAVAEGRPLPAFDERDLELRKLRAELAELRAEVAVLRQPPGRSPSGPRGSSSPR